MKLVIDIGNSQIYAGIFDGEELVSRFRKITQRGASSDELGLFFRQAVNYRFSGPSAEGTAIARSGTRSPFTSPAPATVPDRDSAMSPVKVSLSVGRPRSRFEMNRTSSSPEAPASDTTVITSQVWPPEKVRISPTIRSTCSRANRSPTSA